MLSVREISENIEQETLAPWAAKSSQAVRDSEELPMICARLSSVIGTGSSQYSFS